MPLIRKDSAPAVADAATASTSLAALRSLSGEERWAAVRDCPITPAGIEALGEILAHEEDARVREAIFTRLARTASPEAVAVVLPHLRSNDANIRTGALDALRAMTGAVEPHLKDLLGDSDQDVRLLACEIVRGLPGGVATDLLCTVLDSEDEPNVCAAAVEVLAEIGSPTALPALARLGARFPHEQFLGFAIKVASKRIGDQAASHE